jgi:emfourin
MDIKRIQFERTGGFAGIRFAADFELDDLPKDQARQILELLDDMDFNGLPEQILGGQQVADGFSYSITVVTEKRQHSVTTSDMAAPKKMEPLLEILTQIAKQQARNRK